MKGINNRQPAAVANPIRPIDRIGTLAIDAVQLGKLLGLSLRTIRRLDSSGRIPRPVRIGGAVRWRIEEITAWLEEDCPSRRQWEAIQELRKRKREGTLR
jgi:predicted DNA-binding transcriptional regulator AlpA